MLRSVRNLLPVAIGCGVLYAIKSRQSVTHERETHNLSTSPYWEGMAHRMVANLHTDPQILTTKVTKAMTDPRFVTTLGGMKDAFERGDVDHLDKAYFLERAPFIHDVKQLEDELAKLKEKWNDKYPTLGPSPAPNRIEIIGAGMAGLCLAVRLNMVYPSAKIDIHEKRKRDNTCDRFQTLSIRFGRKDRCCETVFEGTDFLKDNGLFEDAGGWKEPLRPGQTDTERRLRAPIGVFQDALIKYLSQKEGVQIHYNSNPGLTPRPDGVDYRFIATGLRKQTPLAPNAPFSLPLTHKIRHAWTFKATNALNIQPSGAIKKEGVYSTMNGGNEIKKLGVFFTAVDKMIDKGFVKHSKMDQFKPQIQTLINQSESDQDIEKKYCQVDVDSQFYIDGKTSDPDESAWYSFDCTPSIGMDPFYLASDGRTIALGDHVNARHPFLGNGTLGIFKNIDNIMGHIERNQRLKSLPDSTTDLELSRSITTKQHQSENTRQLLMSIRQYLVYLKETTPKKP